MPALPAKTDALHLLWQDLLGHLDESEYLANKCDDWSDEDIEAARELIPNVITVIRGVLLQHEPSDTGTCPGCSTEWPCTVADTIHKLVKDPETQFVKLLEARWNAE